MSNYGFPTNLDAIIFTNSIEEIKYFIETKYSIEDYNLSYSDTQSLLPLESSNITHIVTEGSYDHRHKGVRIYTLQQPISVLIMNFHERSLGNYLSFPSCDFFIPHYQYYAVSASSYLVEKRSEMLLIGNANNTVITVTPSVNVNMPSDAQDPNISHPLITIANGKAHTIVLNEFDTLLVKAVNRYSDLTGTKVVSNKPLTVISGHECANVPTHSRYCDHISVQIPPTITWGQRFLLTPFGNRTVGQYYKMIAGRRNVTVEQTCVSGKYIMEKAGDSVTFFTTSTTYCYVESNKPVLLAQLALGGIIDGTGDPTIAIVSPLEQYSTEVLFAIDVQDVYYAIPVSYINIMTVTMPEVIYMDNTSLSVVWNPIRGIDGSIVGYGTQVANVSTGTHILSTPDDVKMSVMVYGFSSYDGAGYSYTAGMNLESLVESKHNLIYMYFINEIALNCQEPLPVHMPAYIKLVYIKACCFSENG